MRSSRSETAATVEVDDQLQNLWHVGDVDDPQAGVHGQDGRGEHGQDGAYVTGVLVGLVGRAGEPQRRADQPADGMPRSTEPRSHGCRPRRGASRWGGRARPSGGELRRQPGQCGRRGEGQRAERADHEAVQRLSRSAAAAGAPPPRAPASGSCCRSGCRVLPAASGPPRCPRPAARRMSGPPPRRSAAPTRRRARYPDAAVRSSVRRGQIAVDVGLLQVQQEQQRQAERGHRDQAPRACRSVANVDQRDQHERPGRSGTASGTGAADAGTANWPATAAAGAHRARRRSRSRNHDGPFPRLLVSDGHRRGRRIRLREPRSDRPGTPSWPAAVVGSGVLMPSLLQDEDVAHQVIDVGSAESGDQVIAGRRIGDRVAAEGDVAEAGQP